MDRGVQKRPHQGRRQGRTTWIGVACFLFVVVCALPAQAQTNGIKVGEGRTHLSLEFEGGYDSLAGVGFGGTDTVGDFVLKVSPGLSMEIPTPTSIFNLDARGAWNGYLGIDTRGTRSLSYFGGDAHVGLHFNPHGRFGLQIGDRFSRSDRTSAVGLGVGVLSIFNEIYLVFPIRPGGGALGIRPAYSFAFEGFANSQTVTTLTDEAHRLNYMSHRPALEVSWRFLPKTALVLDVRGDIRRYMDTTVNTPTNALYALLGLSGLITPKVGLVARAGYGNTFVPEANQAAGVPNYQSFIGQLDGTFIFSETARLKAGVARTFFPVPRLGWYGDNRVYASGQALIGGRLLTETEMAFHFLNYANGRQDALFQPTFSAQYRITPWMTAGAGYRYSLRRSDDDAIALPAATNYDRHEIFGSISLRY